MGCGRCYYLYIPLVLKLLERLDQISSIFRELPPNPAVVFPPHIGEFGHIPLAASPELLLVFLGGLYLHPHVFPELLGEGMVRKLLHEYRGYAHRDLRGYALIREPPEHIEERYVAFGSGFIYPIHPMGPSPMGEDIWEMGMKDKAKIPFNFRHINTPSFP